MTYRHLYGSWVYTGDDDDSSWFTDSFEEEKIQTWRDRKRNKPKTFLSQVPVTKVDFSLLRAGLPSEFKPWVSTAQTGRQFSLKKIQPSDPVYVEVVNRIKLNGDIRRITITSIQRVICPYLMALYQLKKLDMTRIHGHQLKEMELFHGTDEFNSDGICDNNFNYRLCGSSRGTKYGQGVSFSPFFFYAKCFCNKSDKEKTIFLCDVMYVRAHVGHEDYLVPDEGFDTTAKEKGEVYVKYDDDMFVPRYKIKFMLIK